MCEDGIDKYVPLDHHVSSLRKPCDAKSDPRDEFFYLNLTFIDTNSHTVNVINCNKLKYTILIML